MKNRVIYYDLLKVISIFAVIIMHIIGNTINTFNLNGFSKEIYNFICIICYFAVPIFVMVSGGIFLNPNKKIEINNIIKKYCLRILLCLFIFGFVYSMLEIYFNTKTLNLEMILESIKNIITGNLWAHMWYLYLIFGLYLLTPIFRIITKNVNEKEYKYLLILLFIFTILINDINSILNLNIAFNILIYSPYVLLYFLGDYLNRYEIKEKIKKVIYLSSFISIIIIFLNNFFNLFSFYNFSYTCLLVFNIILSIFIFIKDRKIKLNKFIISISECSLGIYLIHQLIINIIFKLLKVDIILDYPYICLVIYVLITFIISYVITYLLRKINLINKYIL